MKPLLHLLQLLVLIALAAVLLALLESPPVGALLADPEPDDDGDDDEDTDIYEPDLGDPIAHRPTVRKAVTS